LANLTLNATNELLQIVTVGTPTVTVMSTAFDALITAATLTLSGAVEASAQAYALLSGAGYLSGVAAARLFRAISAASDPSPPR
jgi:hypothetical protein